MEASKECCVECQEQNPFFKLGGGVVGKFAYTRETPFIQPFESIESPWADFIKADSMETNIKKLFKLAQKYKKDQFEKKPEEEKPKEKQKPKERERTKSASRPRRTAELSAKGKEKVIVIDEPQEETRGVLTRAQLDTLQSRWKSINASNQRLSRSEKQDNLYGSKIGRYN
jgi:hypothetical protein